MAQKILRKSRWFWQDYNGTAWNNVEWANSGEEGLGSYVYPTGTKPKSLFYHYQVGGLDDSKHKLDKVEFILIIRKFKSSENTLPTIKVFYGDNNAPYTKSPIKTVNTYKRLDNQFWYDEYTLAYDLTGVTIAQLKNIIVEVDWKKSKVDYKTTISVNRGRLEVNYSSKEPKWSLYESINRTNQYVNNKVAWKLTVKNSGYCGSNSITLRLPKGVTVASSTGGGSYNNNTNTWTVNNVCKNKSVTRTFYITSKSVGLKNLQALNNSPYKTNTNVQRQVSWIKKPVQPVEQHYAKNDIITYTHYEVFEKENCQYFDVCIEGFKENHPYGGACYKITATDNVDLYKPLRTYVELLEDEENINIRELVRDSTVTYDDITVTIDDDTVCFKLNNKNADFIANIRVYLYANDDTEFTVSTVTPNDTIAEVFDILPMRGAKLTIVPPISKDKAYVQNSVSIGSPLVWNLNSKAHRHNFFDEMKDLMEIEIEPMIAYIGVVPLSRCHKADVTADVKNTLIENRYLNRAYYGKKGDYSENIKMTLRIPWYDVATLEGLVEMDKPIPIDTIPYFPDGDPLNHRGWAEISGLSNIKKINDLYYECDVEVTYLTHDILTRFTISEAEKITKQSIEYYLSLIHNYGDDLLDIFKLNFYEFWTTLEDGNGDKIGSYSIEPNANLTLTKDLEKYSSYDIVFRNTLPSLMSEDYDSNWEMYLRVIDKANQQTVFEHSYTNFKHYDFDTQYPVNTADANTVYAKSDGNFNTLNFEKVGLGYGSLAPLIEDRKIKTHFNTMEDTTISDYGELFEIFLLDDKNEGIPNKTVTVKIVGNDGYRNKINITTDTWGRVLFNPLFNNDEYSLTFTFNEDETYRSCTYSTNLTVDFNYVLYHFEYPSNPTVLRTEYPYKVQLLDDNDDGVSDIMLHYSFRDLGSDSYGYERTVVTDENGYATIPIDWVNGTKMLKVALKGFTYNSTVYQPVMFEEEVNINVS